MTNFFHLPDFPRPCDSQRNISDRRKRTITRICPATFARTEEPGRGCPEPVSRHLRYPEVFLIDRQGRLQSRPDSGEPFENLEAM